MTREPTRTKMSGPAGAAWLQNDKWQWRSNGYRGESESLEDAYTQMDAAQKLRVNS